MRRTFALISAVLVALVLAGCASGNPLGDETTASAGDGGQIIVGSASFTESEVLAEIYAGALRAKGIDATTKTRIGAREVYLQALKDGSISMVPEYTGNLLQYLDPENPARSASDIEAALPEAVGPDLKVLDAAEASNQDVYVVTKSFADEHDLVSLGDLASGAPGWVLGGPTELEARPYGPDGLKSVYGVSFKSFQVYNSQAVKIKDLQDGKVQVASFFTTDSVLASSDYVQLTDPEEMIIPQNVIPLTAKSVADNEAAVEAINAVQAKLTTKALMTLNGQVDDEHKTPADAAAQWLKDQGLD